MRYEYYDKYVNKRTKLRYDVTLIFQNPEVFSNLVNDMIKPFKDKQFNVIAGIDALGFIIGGAIAHKLKMSFVPVRKGGKLPGINGTLIRISFTDYTKKKKTFEINKGAIKKGDKVLIIDEWIETGSQAKSAIKLIEKQGGKVIGISALCAEKTPKTRILFEKYNCRAIGITEGQ